MNPDLLNGQSVVDMLEPLREPAAVSWWPPAPGWWVLAALLLALLAWALRRAWAFHRRGAPLREARTCLVEIRAKQQTPLETLAELAELRRRVALRLAGPAAVAGLTGERLADFLNGMSGVTEPCFDATLLDAHYLPDSDPRDCADALDATERWLNSLVRPR